MILHLVSVSVSFPLHPQSFFTDEEISILKKFKLYVEDNWNKCDMVAMSLFVVGVSCRYVSRGVRVRRRQNEWQNSE